MYGKTMDLKRSSEECAGGQLFPTQSRASFQYYGVLRVVFCGIVRVPDSSGVGDGVTAGALLRCRVSR